MSQCASSSEQVDYFSVLSKRIVNLYIIYLFLLKNRELVGSDEDKLLHSILGTLIFS